MPPNNDLEELKTLILQNQRLLAENNEILKKMHRSAVRHLWFNIVWVFILLGLPVIMYYYILAPYLESFGDMIPYQMPDFDKLLELQGASLVPLNRD